MTSNSPGPSGRASNTTDFSSLPRGLLGRKGLPIARGARLPSIRTPRDLTLGTSAAPKRTFTPNLNVRREKNRETETDIPVLKKDTKDGKRGNRSQERGRGRGRGRGELIQMQGSIFGEGPSAAMLQRKGSFRRVEEGSKNHIPVPKLNLSTKCRTKEEKLQDEEKLQELLRDDFVDDIDGNDAKMQPIELPLLGWHLKLEKDGKCLLKTEKQEEDKVIIKKDPDAMEVDEPDAAKPEIKTPFQGAKEISAAEIFSNSNLPETGTLLFFQFPDTLPGIASSSDDARPNSKSKAGTSAQPSSDDTEPTRTDRVLADFPEGYIGKLQVLKSGKTRLKLGSVAFTVDSGTPLGFLQDLVSVKVKDDAPCDMVVLGHIQHKLVCTPDLGDMLTAKTT